MPKSRSKSSSTHASRIPGDEVVCDCGETFPDDAAWRRHYESETTAKERERLEGRADD